MSEEESKVEHGVEVACYSNGHSGYLPVFRCLCGWGSGYGNVSWEEAGLDFDEHLESVKDGAE